MKHFEPIQKILGINHKIPSIQPENYENVHLDEESILQSNWNSMGRVASMPKNKRKWSSMCSHLERSSISPQCRCQLDVPILLRVYNHIAKDLTRVPWTRSV